MDTQAGFVVSVLRSFIIFTKSCLFCFVSALLLLSLASYSVENLMTNTLSHLCALFCTQDTVSKLLSSFFKEDKTKREWDNYAVISDVFLSL